MLDRTQAPPSYPLTVPTLPLPQITRHRNSSQLAIFQDTNQHLVSVDMVFPAADLHTQRRQLDWYAFKMLLEGTATRTAKKLADDISFLGATVDIAHHADYEAISISCLSRYLGKVLDILNDMWQNSQFPAKEWKTIQETATQQNAINLQKTAFLAGKRLRKELFGDRYDYGYSFENERVSKITNDELKAHFDALQVVGPGLVVVSGFAEAAHLQQLSDWMESFLVIKNRPTFNDVLLTRPQGATHWEPLANSQQASLRMGQFAINSQHPDSPLLNLTLEIFGGYFGSRLMCNIREDKGWTYGIFAQRVAYLAQPYWLIGSDVKGEMVLETVSEIRKEAEILRNHPAPDDEMEKVKNYMLGQFLSSITNCYGVADRYKSVWLNGIDFARVEKNLHTIQNATSADVLETARKYLVLDDAVVAISGNPV